MSYNYYESMKANIKQYLEDEFERCYSNVDSLEELSEKLHDDLWTNDSITGNASGSYTCNSSEAKEYVLDNMDLCKEALESFCTPAEEIGNRFLDEDWEYLDVTIRCYILGSVISELLEDAEEDFEKWLEEKEAEDEE
jgi:hypothetical protein